MRISLNFCRRSLLMSAALLVVAALVIALAVIPPVKTDTFPLAAPERAAAAFLVVVVFNLFDGAVLGFIGYRTNGRSLLSTIVLWLLTLLTLLFTLALIDAAFSFWAHGPALRLAAILLQCCAVAELVAGLLVLTTALFLPKRI